MSISLLDLVLSFRPSIPRRRSLRCVCSKVTFICGIVSFTTGLSGWIFRSRSSIFLIICIVCVGIVGLRVCLTITIINVVIVSTIRVISGWVFFSFELTALIPIVTWFLQWWQVGLGFSEFCCVACCVTVFICISSGASKPFSSNLFSRCNTICSLCHSPNAPG